MRFAQVMSSAVAVWLTMVSIAAAHEVIPTVMEMAQEGRTLTFVAGPEGLGTNLEAFIAGIDLSSVTDINEAANAAAYDALRAMEPDALTEAMEDYWPRMAEQISVTAAGQPLALTLISIDIPEVGNIEFLRPSVLTFAAELPEGANDVTVGWAAELGGLVLTQTGVDAPYNGYLINGAMSPPIVLDGGS